MASNDGKHLTVFGLSFRQHDNRQMQHILRQYHRLPSNPGNRAALFTSLFDLSKDLGDDEAQGIKTWLQSGGAPDGFPAPKASSPPLAMSDIIDGDGNTEDEGEGEWPEYNPADFEGEDVEMEDSFGSRSVEEDQPQNLEAHDEHLDQDTNYSSEGMSSDPIQGGNAMRAGNAGRESDEDQYDEEAPENECDVCMEVKESADLLAPAKITPNCKHDHERRVCFPCIERHIHATIEYGALGDLRCPSCHEKLSYEEMKRYASAETFARYEYLIFISNPDVIMCLGPGCGSRQTHTDTTSPKMICNTCFFATCVHHKLPWHEGETCEEFDCNDTAIERLEEAELSAKLLAKDQSKICPSCGQGVTKQEGCDHLTCRCGENWCFECLASWDNILRIGDEAHAPTCSYHPRKILKSKAQQAAGQARMTESLLGGRASEALLRAREARNERVRAELRPKALEAAEARMKAERERIKEERKKEMPQSKKRKVRLLPTWEER